MLWFYSSSALLLPQQDPGNVVESALEGQILRLAAVQVVGRVRVHRARAGAHEVLDNAQESPRGRQMERGVTVQVGHVHRADGLREHELDRELEALKKRGQGRKVGLGGQEKFMKKL